MRLAPLLLTVFGPLVLWAAVYASVMAYRDDDARTAEANAGRIVNARVVDGDVTQVIDRMLATRDPRIVVLGPSYANTDVRPGLLARQLGLDPQDVALVSVPNSTGAHWYAILKYRVIDAGYRPDLVMVVSGLQSMLLTTPLSESSFVNLQVQLPEAGDPQIDAKVRGSTNLWWATVREQRGKVRGAFFDTIRDRAVFWRSPPSTRRALGRVFDDANVDMTLYDHAMPVVEGVARRDRGYTPDLLPTPEASFLSEVTALATETGLQIAWVRPPMSPTIPANRDDVVPEGFQRRAQAVVRDHGGHFVDLRHLRMSAAMFRNEDHMNQEGSLRFTEALATLVRDRGWIGAPDLARGPRTVILGAGRSALGPRVTLTTPRPVARVPQATRPVVDAPGLAAAFATPKIHFLSAASLEAAVGMSAACSPLRVTEDGTELPDANAPCAAVDEGRGSCHAQDQLRFTASDRTDPATNGRAYALVLAEDRTCDGHVFLYPKDLLQFAVNPREPGPFSLVIDARYLQHRAARVTLRVRAGDEVVFEQTVANRRLDPGPWIVALPPLPEGDTLVVEFENLDRTFYVLRELALVSTR